jgi:hypothetical protein
LISLYFQDFEFLPKTEKKTGPRDFFFFLLKRDKLELGKIKTASVSVMNTKGRKKKQKVRKKVIARRV